MPSLQHLIDDVRKVGAKPADVRIPGSLFDDLIGQVEDEDEEVEDEDEDE